MCRPLSLRQPDLERQARKFAGDLTELLNGTVRNQFFRVWVSHADDLSKPCCTTATGPSEALRAGLPLKRVWVLVEE